mgnify:CR=1 FL=1
MTSELKIMLCDIYRLLQKEDGSDGQCIAVDIRFTADGYYITYDTKTPGGLRKASISMQNIFGENIE